MMFPNFDIRQTNYGEEDEREKGEEEDGDVENRLQRRHYLNGIIFYQS